jgi:hypothetical protein
MLVPRYTNISELPFRRRRAELLEDSEAQMQRSTVTIEEPDIIGIIGTDFTDWQVLTIRTSDSNRRGVHTAFVTHVGPDGEGHEWMIPGEVVRRIAAHMEMLTKKHRSSQALRGKRTKADHLRPSAHPETDTGQQKAYRQQMAALHSANALRNHQEESL